MPTNQTVTYSESGNCVTISPLEGTVHKSANVLQLSVTAGLTIAWIGVARSFFSNKSAPGSSGQKNLTWPLATVPTGVYQYDVHSAGNPVSQCGPPEKPSMTVEP